MAIRGRKAGSLNKKTLLALGVLKKRDCDPIEFLAAVIQKDGAFLQVDASHITLDHRLTAAKILTPCVVPTLKSIEVDQLNPPQLLIQVINRTTPPVSGDNAKVVENSSVPSLTPQTKFSVPIPESKIKKWAGSPRHKRPHQPEGEPS